MSMHFRIGERSIGPIDLKNPICIEGYTYLLRDSAAIVTVSLTDDTFHKLREQWLGLPQGKHISSCTVTGDLARNILFNWNRHDHK